MTPPFIWISCLLLHLKHSCHLKGSDYEWWFADWYWCQIQLHLPHFRQVHKWYINDDNTKHIIILIMSWLIWFRRAAKAASNIMFWENPEYLLIIPLSHLNVFIFVVCLQIFAYFYGQKAPSYSCINHSCSPSVWLSLKLAVLCPHFSNWLTVSDRHTGQPQVIDCSLL